MSIRPYPGRDFKALYEVFRIWETVRRLGFTPREFELQMRQQLRQAEAFDRNAGLIGYEVYATLYQTHFLQGIPVVEPAERGALLRKVLAGLTLADVNDWMTGGRRATTTAFSSYRGTIPITIIRRSKPFWAPRPKPARRSRNSRHSPMTPYR